MTTGCLGALDYAAPYAAMAVDYRVLVPAAACPGRRLPLILHLHGAMSSAAPPRTRPSTPRLVRAR